jgi:hypothetical protein
MKDISEEVKLEALGGDYPKPILIKNLGMMFATKNSKQKTRFGLYKCGFCGEEFRTQISNVKNGSTKSCGCYMKRRASETHKTHGLGSTRLSTIWREIKRRTLNPKHKRYIDYGGRGITICGEWLDIQNFYDWALSNGYEENKGLSIDRIDNNGNYCPENCRWVTRTIQSRNQRMQKNNKSGYKGVCFKKDKNKYAAQICVNNKNKGLGLFPTAVEAAKAYNNYIIENNLEGFILNEIPEEYKND